MSDDAATTGPEESEAAGAAAGAAEAAPAEGAAAEAPAERQPVFSHDGRRVEVGPERIAAYNFRSPSGCKLGDLRHLDVATRKFLEHLSARLSTFLRLESVAKFGKLGPATFGQFTGTIADPTYVALFQVQGLTGIGILELTLPAGLAMADRMLGGKGKLTDANRALTEIETALVEDVAQLILAEWTRHFPEPEGGAGALTPVIVGHDSSARFLNTAEEESLHIVLVSELTVGKSVGQMQLAVPFAMLEPVLKKMEGTLPKGSERKPRVMEWRPQFDGIHVPVVAEWVVKKMAVRDVIQLKTGDVIEMSRDVIGQTHVRLSNATEFIGTAGVEEGCVAVQLTQRTTTE